MPELGELVVKVRSKNAGPYWITVDVFCGAQEVLERVSTALDSETVARLFGTPTETLRRFTVAELSVLKFSFPRSHVQGDPLDRDMHGASYASILSECRQD